MGYWWKFLGLFEDKRFPEIKVREMKVREPIQPRKVGVNGGRKKKSTQY